MKMARTVVITGFMGCGKSKIARALARHLDLTMVDLDESITARTGRTPAQLINEEGERAFRRIESDTLREVLRIGAAGVIALGGGAWIEAENRELINQYSCASVWLDVPFEVCWSRIESADEDRPLGKTRSQAQARFESRRPVYQLAAIHIEVTNDDDLASLVTCIETAIDA
jgi:shikimate kinase